MSQVLSYACYDFNESCYLIEMVLDIFASDIDWDNIAVPEMELSRSSWQRLPTWNNISTKTEQKEYASCFTNQPKRLNRVESCFSSTNRRIASTMCPLTYSKHRMAISRSKTQHPFLSG